MLIFITLTVGFSGLIAEVLLLRELLVSFYGNELSVGLILANWVAAEAAGVFVFGRVIERAKNKLAVFLGLNVVFALSFITCIWLARTFKLMLGIPPGLGIGINSVFWISLLVIFPASFTHGGLFTCCAKVYSLYCKSANRAASWVYFWETVGTICAGVGLTYYLIPRFNSFLIAAGAVCLNLVACFYLLSKQKAGFRFLKALTAILLIGSSYLFFSAKWEEVHQESIKKQWTDYKIVDYANSFYGNIVVIRDQGQYTFFSNGQPIITAPHPDLIFVEEFANFPLLFHPSPRDVLVISGGVGGLINQVLRMPSVEKIDYVELDPLVLKLVRKFPTDLTRSELSDSRVKTINSDGRFFIQQTKSRYDVIFLGISDISDLQSNRLFTEEFFTKAKERLKVGGILAFSLPGSLTYLTANLRDLNACILNSLKGVFTYTQVVPGDLNLFLSSDSGDLTKVTSSLINDRILARGLKLDLLTPGYVDYRLNPRWRNWFMDNMPQATTRSNHDFSGFALFKATSIWNDKFSPNFKGVFSALERISLSAILYAIFGFTLMFLIACSLKPKFKQYAIPYAIVTTGFFGMLMYLLIMFAFQVVYGYLYFEIGMMIAVFMAGAAIGSIILSRYLDRINRDILFFGACEVAITCSVFIILWVMLSYPQRFVFFLLSFVVGFGVGFEFPLANKIYLGQVGKFGEAIGFIYSADLIGGWIAGVLSGVLFLPLLGFTHTCVVILALKLSSLAILSGSGLSKSSLK